MHSTTPDAVVWMEPSVIMQDDALTRAACQTLWLILLETVSQVASMLSAVSQVEQIVFLPKWQVLDNALPKAAYQAAASWSVATSLVTLWLTLSNTVLQAALTALALPSATR